MTHRGPDAEGFYQDQGLCMGMRRLSIIDLTGGQQPLYNEDRSVALIFNGEIYNYVELREELQQQGHRFRTASDGEAILHLYEEKGTDFLIHLNGMFAICLWDVRNERGLLARDHLGIKPLYYWSDGGRLAFASELKALLSVVPAVEMDADAIRLYLQHMYVPGPLSPIRGIRKLLPATLLEFSPSGVGDPKTFWDVRGEDDGGERGEQDREVFLRLADDAARLQLRSDVPVGIFLSGGIDSSTVAAFSRKWMGDQVSCFTVEYEGNPVNEVGAAATVSKFLRCNHYVTRVAFADVGQQLPKLVWHMDEPHADSAMLGTYMVAKLAASHVKVVLNGTGGDELFGGYPWYVGSSWRARLMHRVPSVLRAGCATLLPRNRYTALLEAHRDRFATFLWSHLQFKPQEVQGFLAGQPSPPDGWSMQRLLDNATGDQVNRMLYTDLKSYLVDDLLLLLDKMVMAASIEGRVPLLDYRIVEMAFGLPGRVKLPGVELKQLLKRWVTGILPQEIIQRPKWGFGAPVMHWMQSGLLDQAVRLIQTRPADRQHLFWGLRGNELSAHFAGLSPQKVFALLMLELWFRIFIDRADPQVSLMELAG
jgi:asparagine synthase (glutamine-hydrolysing)